MLKIGDEISLNLKDVPDLKDCKKGDEVELEFKCKVIGQHSHSLGKTEKMIDVQVVEIEADYEGEDDGEEKQE